MEPEIINQEVAQNINQSAPPVPEPVFKKSKIALFLAYTMSIGYLLVLIMDFVRFHVIKFLNGNIMDTLPLLAFLASILIISTNKKSSYRVGVIILFAYIVLVILFMIGLGFVAHEWQAGN